jgi:Spy/CpxP family protein refolding chaperone
MKTLEALCKEAKEENAAMSKEMKPPAGGPAGRVAIQEYYQGQQKKQDALMEKYQARINDILTAEQRTVLSQIKAIADEKKEQDKKTNEEIRRLIEKNQEAFESKLNAILTPEQKKKLDEISSTATPRGAGPTTEPAKVNVEK